MGYRYLTMQSLAKKDQQKNTINPLRDIDKGSLSDKSGFSVFCGATGCGFVIPTPDGKCPSCKERIVRQSTYDSAVKLFLSIVETNRQFFNRHIYDSFESKDLQFLVNIGRIHYWVPARYFQELENLERTDRSQLENFFEYIKEHCKTFKP